MKRDDRPTLFCIYGGPGLDPKLVVSGLQSLQNLFNLEFIDLCWDDASSVETYASQVCAAVQKTAPASPIGILGHSFGGHVAIEALAAAPAFFDFGILCATFCNATDWVAYMSFTAKVVDHSNASALEKHYHHLLTNDALPSIYTTIDMTQRCRRIMARCLVMGGGQDKIIPPDEPEKLTKLIHNAQSVVIPNAGHFPFLTQSEAFREGIEKWWLA